jgi:translation initiation factor 2 alpha subunit (eIF-2alpha)
MVEIEDIVLCTVEKIESNTVFVNVDEENRKGTIVISEIAPGRIRNIRDFVVPNKKIACKVLRIFPDHLDLSLRRVSTKEKTEILNKYQLEQTSKSALRQILKEKAEQVISKIQGNFKLISEFIINARENSKLIEEYIPKEFQDSIKKMIQKKKKEVEVKKTIELKCFDEPDGLVRIKKILLKKEDAEVNYISAGKFSLSVKAEDYKKANQILDSLIQEIEKDSKSLKCHFELQK